ncbi:unnamed protein product [Linum trigynum]|uniref:Uncharacterized protein n=1 Tax=Linum trigynum TaxID=586398 RepID=A0AAV2GIZ3_9ROSI
MARSLRSTTCSFLFVMLILLLPLFTAQAARPLVEAAAAEVPSTTPPAPLRRDNVKEGVKGSSLMIGISRVTFSGPSPGEGH